MRIHCGVCGYTPEEDVQNTSQTGHRTSEHFEKTKDESHLNFETKDVSHLNFVLKYVDSHISTLSKTEKL